MDTSDKKASEFFFFFIFNRPGARCQVSHVRCHMSDVPCQHFFYFLEGGRVKSCGASRLGWVINGAYPV